MPTPLLNSRDLAFQLYEVLQADALCARPRFADYNRESFDAAIAMARGIAETHFAPHNRRNDTEEPRFEGGKVLVHPEVRGAIAAAADAGILAACNDAEVGGMQLPHTIATAVMAYLEAANVGTSAYALLTTGAANLIGVFGDADQQERFLRPMLAGRFLGTMALTEPEAGSSLADIRTVATPADDGTYRITGTKMWISGGDHEMSENIVHLVLARIAGAPEGVRGISLFVVPKYLVHADGVVGDRNGVALAGIIHKMGWRGTVSTILNFGESGPCVGYLVGEPHKGLSYMFHMMNEARIGVGRAGMAMAYAAYLYALDYARTRRQGRVPGDKTPSQQPVPIIAHADVRRMLLAQKATVEGALALVLECAHLVDEQETAPTAEGRARAQLLLEVLTPIAKSFPAEAGQESISHAIQVLGGYGFAREYGVEQYYRDNRLNALHEGTTGIQALDLLGRKMLMQQGAAYRALVAYIGETVQEGARLPEMAELATSLSTMLTRLTATTAAVGARMATTEPARVLANATVYLEVASRVVVAWLWLRQGVVAARALPTAVQEDERAFYLGKLQAARYFFAWELPKAGPALELLDRSDPLPFEMHEDWY